MHLPIYLNFLALSVEFTLYLNAIHHQGKHYHQRQVDNIVSIVLFKNKRRKRPLFCVIMTAKNLLLYYARNLSKNRNCLETVYSDWFNFPLLPGTI